MSETGKAQDEIRKKLRRGERISQEETSVLVDQYMIDAAADARKKEKKKRQK